MSKVTEMAGAEKEANPLFYVIKVRVVNHEPILTVLRTLTGDDPAPNR